MTIGQAVRRRREALGMSQSYLAEISGVCRVSIVRIEGDKFVPPIKTLDKLSKRLLCTTSDLLSAREATDEPG